MKRIALLIIILAIPCLLLARRGVQAAEQKGKVRTGTLTGVVTDKGNHKSGDNSWIEIKPDGAETARRHSPAADPQVGGPNRKVLAAIRAVAIGSRVRIEWIDAGDGKDITRFEVLKAPK